jgi:CO/xanthine dehydrogenase FAD-binding subunit
MRTDVNDFNLTAPRGLDAVLQMLNTQPGRYTPIAGGTELMVALNVGRLQQRELVSLNHLRELRFLHEADGELHLGAGTTFTDIRRSELIAKRLPLLASSAAWTGSVANQNRGTLGGNLCNASPAADSPPALLVYGAKVKLVSTRGERWLPYDHFHLGYKKTALAADELLHTISVPLEFDNARQWIRKVGTRNAQAISKVALAAVAKLDGTTLTEIRLGAASLSDRPMRCLAAENALTGASLASDRLETTVRLARAALASEAKPIDDIRSTARYRAHVAANLLEEFLRSLAG